MRAYKAVAYLLIALGVVHVCLTPLLFKEFTLRALDFVCRGLVGVFLGFLNIVSWRHGAADLIVRALCLSANVLVTLLFGIALLFAGQSPQGYTIVAVLAFLTGCSFLVGGKPTSDLEA